MHKKVTRYVAVGFALALLGRMGSDSTSSSGTQAAATTAAGGTTAGGTTPGSEGGAAGELKTGLTIAVIPKAINNAYFDAAFTGAQKACTELAADLRAGWADGGNRRSTNLVHQHGDPEGRRCDRDLRRRC